MPDFRETALIFGKAVLSVEPLTGAAIKAIEDFRTAAREKATGELMQALGERLSALEGRWEAETFATRDFVDLFQSCLAVTDRTQESEKLRAAANVLANALLREGDAEKLAFTELDHFARCLERLSLGSIRALPVLIDRLGYIDPRLPDHGSAIPPSSIATAIGVDDEDLAGGFAEELVQHGLARLLADKRKRTFGFDSHSSESLYKATGLGERFMQHVLSGVVPAYSADG